MLVITVFYCTKIRFQHREVGGGVQRRPLCTEPADAGDEWLHVQTE